MIFNGLQEDLLIHGDSVYDIVDKQDHASVQSEMGRAVGVGGVGGVDDSRLFLCRMYVSRNARRQMRFGDQKVSSFPHPQKSLKIPKMIKYDRFNDIHLFQNVSKWIRNPKRSSKSLNDTWKSLKSLQNPKNPEIVSNCLQID